MLGVCAEAGHPQTVMWLECCDHDGHFRVTLSQGTCDTPGEPTYFNFGPFDGSVDLDELVHEAVLEFAERSGLAS